MSIKQIDLGLSRYYNRHQVEYYKDKEDDQSGKFTNWCNDNGYDTDGIRDELENEPSECVLIEFDQEDFPFTKVDQDERNKEIFVIIKYCFESSEAFLNSTEPTSPIPTDDECSITRETIQFYEDHKVKLNDIIPIKPSTKSDDRSIPKSSDILWSFNSIELIVSGYINSIFVYHRLVPKEIIILCMNFTNQYQKVNLCVNATELLN